MKNSIVILLTVLCAVGCANNRKAEQFKALPFPNVTAPAMIQDQQELAEFMAEHWWDGLTDTQRDYPCDSTLVSGVSRGDVEQKFADWTSIMEYAGHGVWSKAVGNLYDRALACERKDTASQVFETFVDLFQKYFYDPNSPVRNEDVYYHFVSRYASYEGLSDVLRAKYEREARLSALNKVGTKATDFRFADRRGKIRSLYDINADLTLVFFSNPGCNACMEIINVLKEEPVISSLILSGKMAVLNIYIDEDIQAWRSYMPIYPEEWYNGFDPDLVIRTDNTYHVRAIPSLYLLDADKTVLLKDATVERLLSAIHSL